MLISHDRRLLERISRATVWLDRGITRTLDRGFAAFEPWRDAVLEQEETDRHKLGRKIVMEEDWLRYGVTARRKRNVRRLGELHALRKQRRERRAALGTVRLEIARGRTVGPVGGGRRGRDEGRMATGRSCGIFPPASCAATGSASSGPNGAGKTTLLNLLTGALAPDAGEIRLGTNLAQVTLDQGRETLDPAQTLSQTLTGGAGDTVEVGGQRRHVVGYMKDFLFGPEQANTPVGVLSGGERGRLTLARAFARPSNLLVLDEPTNDLDLETLDLLQERLAEYAGTVLLVSHDRDFLDRVVTSVIAVGGRRALDRIRRRLHRHAGAARAGDGGGSATHSGGRQRRGTCAGGEATAAVPPLAPRRMTFKDRHALETLPARIAALQAEIGAADRGAGRSRSLRARPGPVRRDDPGAGAPRRTRWRRPKNNG